MPKPTALDAAVTAANQEYTRRRGSPAWHLRLPADAKAEAEAVKAKFLAGGYGHLPQRHVARVLMAWGADRGLDVPKEVAIVRWLTDKT